MIFVHSSFGFVLFCVVFFFLAEMLKVREPHISSKLDYVRAGSSVVGCRTVTDPFGLNISALYTHYLKFSCMC